MSWRRSSWSAPEKSLTVARSGSINVEVNSSAVFSRTSIDRASSGAKSGSGEIKLSADISTISWEEVGVTRGPLRKIGFRDSDGFTRRMNSTSAFGKYNTGNQKI